MIAEHPPAWLYEQARLACADEGQAGPEGRQRRKRRRRREQAAAARRAAVAELLEVEALYPAQRLAWLRMNDRQRRRLVAEAYARGLVAAGASEAAVREACFVLLQGAP